jgi:transcriptional regulator CtsR
MNMPLSDSIEQFIKDLMSDSESELEVKRNELAAYFGCAPSQINYVLATRFSPKHGYIIESRRGGSGYVRIIRMMSDGDQCPFIMALIGHIEGKLRLSSAEAMISALVEREIVTESEARLMRAAVSEEAINLPVNSKDILRANIMRSMLISLVTKSSGKGNREE